MKPVPGGEALPGTPEPLVSGFNTYKGYGSDWGLEGLFEGRNLRG